MKLDRITRLNTRKKIGELTRVTHRFKWLRIVSILFDMDAEDADLPCEFQLTVGKKSVMLKVRYYIGDFRQTIRAKFQMPIDARHLYVRQTDALACKILNELIAPRIAAAKKILTASEAHA